jgi:hypothetical protein
MSNEEIWRQIDDFNYEVSDRGNIRNTKTQKILIPSIKNGYQMVHINHKSYTLHRLIAQIFIQNPDNKNKVNHKDGNKLNNITDNLEWVTQKENVQHSVDNKLIQPKLRPVKQFTLDGIFIKEYESIQAASNIVEKTTRAIEKVCNRVNKTAGGFTWQFSNPVQQCDINQAKDIIGYPRYKITPDGNIYSKRSNRAMIQQTNANGYKWIQLCVNNKKKNFYIHQLVAQHFIENPDKKQIVNHIDGNKTNNNVDNLEWVTHSENLIHYHTFLKDKPRKSKNSSSDEEVNDSTDDEVTDDETKYGSLKYLRRLKI